VLVVIVPEPLAREIVAVVVAPLTVPEMLYVGGGGGGEELPPPPHAARTTTIKLSKAKAILHLLRLFMFITLSLPCWIRMSHIRTLGFHLTNLAKIALIIHIPLRM
jgi:hypothetical protein